MVSDWHAYVGRRVPLEIFGPDSIQRQNNVAELYSLIKFLRIKPYSDWTKFNEQIAKPISSGRGAGTAMKRLQVS